MLPRSGREAAISSAVGYNLVYYCDYGSDGPMAKGIGSNLGKATSKFNRIDSSVGITLF